MANEKIEIPEGVDPWDRLPGETDSQFAAFKCYRDMGLVRSVAKSAKIYSKEYSDGKHNSDHRPGRVTMWCADNRWVMRAQFYDAYLDKVEVAGRADVIRNVSEAIGSELVQLTELQLANLIDAMEKGTLTQVTNLAYKDLMDRYAGSPEQRVKSDVALSIDDTPESIRHGFYTEEKASEIANLLAEYDVFTDKVE